METKEKNILTEEIDVILIDVKKELISANEKNEPFNSSHEGYAVLKEEVDELWEAIKHGYKRKQEKIWNDKSAMTAHKKDIKAEAIQVAAMAVKLIQAL